jgi:hypothetical protein
VLVPALPSIAAVSWPRAVLPSGCAHTAIHDHFGDENRNENRFRPEITLAIPIQAATGVMGLNGILDDFYWAIGLLSPHMLYALMMALNWAWRPENQSKPRPVFRPVDRKNNGH